MEITDIDRDVRGFIVDRFLFGRADSLPQNGSLLGNVIDSAGVLELVGFLQDHFAIVVQDDDVVPDNLDSLKNVVAYVARKLQAKS